MLVCWPLIGACNPMTCRQFHPALLAPKGLFDGGNFDYTKRVKESKVAAVESKALAAAHDAMAAQNEALEFVKIAEEKAAAADAILQRTRWLSPYPPSSPPSRVLDPICGVPPCNIVRPLTVCFAPAWLVCVCVCVCVCVWGGCRDVVSEFNAKYEIFEQYKHDNISPETAAVSLTSTPTLT